MIKNDMEKLGFGDIILLKFPFTDQNNIKKRPALVLKDTNDGDIIVCRITSKIYSSIYDFFLDDWKECNLKLPSVIRFHKVATLEKDLIYRVIGKVPERTQTLIKDHLSKLFKEI